MVYKTFDISITESIMDYCDNNDIEYDLWSAPFSTIFELGMSEEDWKKVNHLTKK